MWLAFSGRRTKHQIHGPKVPQSKTPFVRWGNPKWWLPCWMMSTSVHLLPPEHKRWSEISKIFTLGVSKNRGFPPRIIHFNRVFHSKASILGYPYFWKHLLQYGRDACRYEATNGKTTSFHWRVTNAWIFLRVALLTPQLVPTPSWGCRFCSLYIFGNKDADG